MNRKQTYSKLQQEYNQDFFAWINHNVELLHEGKISEIDVENLAEELESMGRRERRELLNRLAVLLSHLLKWKMQPVLRGNSWKYTIQEQRRRILKLLKDSPSLKHELEENLEEAYEDAIFKTVRETGIEKEKFSTKCPFSLSQSLDDSFFPE